MRSYLLMRQVGTPGHGQPPAPPPQEGRCKAMMEVVRKEHGSWMVSKFVAEHNHGLLPGHVLPGGGQGVVLAPAVGTEFESVEAAKTFYYGYGEKLGFKAQTGSNRRSAGSRALIMQRFLCWQGNYLIYRSSISSVGKRKRELTGSCRRCQELRKIRMLQRFLSLELYREGSTGWRGSWSRGSERQS
ncbi:unnamed protein product [Musa banksii]